MEEQLYNGFINVQGEYCKVNVSIFQDKTNDLRYIAVINNNLKRFMEVSINENGIWYDMNHGVTTFSEAVGNLIESKTY